MFRLRIANLVSTPFGGGSYTGHNWLWRAVPMNRKRSPFGVAGALLIAAGVLIVTYILLPPGFWWFLAGIALIVLGVHLGRSC